VNKRHAPALLTPLLAVVVLAAFSLSGLMTGALAHGFVSSLAAGHASPTTRPTRTATRSPATATPVPTQAGPDSAFDFQLTVTPQQIAPGGLITVKVLAFVPGTSTAVAHLTCTLRAPQFGGAPLLTTWPGAQETDAYGVASWQVTVPTDLSGGTYAGDIKVSGTHGRASWKDFRVYVTG
jgi:hypothetical protein